MKNFNGLKKISIKAGTTDEDIFNELLKKKSLVAKQMVIEPGLSVYLLNDGTTIEIFSVGSYYPDYLFSNGNVVVSFQVENIEVMINTLSAKGASLIGNIETFCPSYKYCHLVTNEKTILGLYEQNKFTRI